MRQRAEIFLPLHCSKLQVDQVKLCSVSGIGVWLRKWKRRANQMQNRIAAGSIKQERYWPKSHRALRPVAKNAVPARKFSAMRPTDILRARGRKCQSVQGFIRQ